MVGVYYISKKFKVHRHFQNIFFCIPQKTKKSYIFGNCYKEEQKSYRLKQHWVNDELSLWKGTNMARPENTFHMFITQKEFVTPLSLLHGGRYSYTCRAEFVQSRWYVLLWENLMYFFWKKAACKYKEAWLSNCTFSSNFAIWQPEKMFLYVFALDCVECFFKISIELPLNYVICFISVIKRPINPDICDSNY